MSCEGITIETTTLDEVIEVGVIGPQGPVGPAGPPPDLSSPPPIGDITPNTGNFTTISASGLATLPHIHGSLAGNLYIHVKNTSGGALSRGTPIYTTGTVGATDRVEVAASDHTNPAKMPAIGLLEQDLANNEDGDAVIVGELKMANTNSYSLNQELFVGVGAMTGSRPTTGQVQSIGTVARVQTNTGVIVVNMQEQRPPQEAFAAAVHTHDATAITSGVLSYDRVQETIEYADTDATFVIPPARNVRYRITSTRTTTANAFLPSYAQGGIVGDRYQFTLLSATTTAGIRIVRTPNLPSPVLMVLLNSTNLNVHYTFEAFDLNGLLSYRRVAVDQHFQSYTDIDDLVFADKVFGGGSVTYPCLKANGTTVGSEISLAQRHLLLCPFKFELPLTVTAALLKVGGTGITAALTCGIALYNARNETSQGGSEPYELIYQRVFNIPITAGNSTIEIPLVGPNLIIPRGLYWIGLCVYEGGTARLGQAQPDNLIMQEHVGSNPDITGSSPRCMHTFLLAGDGNTMPAFLLPVRTVEMRVTTPSSTTLRMRVTVPAIYLRFSN
jgi:hypothetical protein